MQETMAMLDKMLISYIIAGFRYNDASALSFINNHKYNTSLKIKTTTIIVYKVQQQRLLW